MLSKILILVLLIILNGILTAFETALASVNQARLRLKSEEGDKKALLIKRVLEEPSSFLLTIQIIIPLIGIFLGVFAAQSLYGDIKNLIINAGIVVTEDVLFLVSAVTITLILSYFSLVFGQLLPKGLASKIPESISYFIIGPMNALSLLARPYVRILSVSAGFLMELFGINDNNIVEEIKKEEIRMIVDASSGSGSIDRHEIEMINNIFEFDDRTVWEIATHRKDICTLSVTADTNEIVSKITDGKYSRIPVYEESIDNIIGILHSKDMMKYLISHNSFESLNLRYIIRKPYYVPITKKTYELFTEMQKEKVHMAIIIDEYGGTAGIVTMEDLIESVMGNILDEYDDEEEPDIVPIDKNTFKINGMTDLKTVNEFFDADLPVDEFDTLGGFIISKLGRIPAEDEYPEIEYYGLLFKITEINEKRIARVRVTRC